MEKNQLAKRIRAFRKLKGQTQMELADRLDISIGILGTIERGTRTPDPELVQRISEVLGISTQELALGSQMKGEQTDAENRQYSNEK